MNLGTLSRGPRTESGMGMYPTDANGNPNPCYDPTRYSWMPYWIDDLTESACKYGTTSIPGQMGGVVGSVAGDVVSGAVDNATAAVTGSMPGSFSIGTVALIAGAVALLISAMKK